ncbi:MAG: molybdopterin molybdotransferase MoeA [Alphaproteobacteria bacterium]|nr:molybdopterin molybdotransferase MoeA [Alphaproteobacteria bacterium]
MPQLSDDCFAFGGRLMTTAEALDRIAEVVTPVTGTEDLGLRAACGRILAEDVIAGLDVPGHDNSAVDGYAVYFADLDPKAETRLPVTGRIAAGHPLGRPARRGEALRIFTGAVMPEGPDTVMMQEDCREEDGPAGERQVIVAPGIRRGSNRRAQAEDVRAGDVILRRGHRLRPQDVGLAAAVGSTALAVYRPLRVAVFSTGDELCEPGAELPPGAIFDSNRYTLAALLEAQGCAVTDLGILPDRLDAVRDALDAAAAEHDMVFTSGGVSVGEEDHVKAAVEALGSLHFWRLAIRPGRPLALGQIGTVPFVGLPGNPVAVMVTFLRIARPLVLGLAGCTDIAPTLYRVTAGFDYKKKANRREWLRVRLVTQGDGGLAAEKFPRDGAGILSSLVDADGLVELPEDMTQLTTGTMVDFLPFNEVGR